MLVDFFYEQAFAAGVGEGPVLLGIAGGCDGDEFDAGGGREVPREQISDELGLGAGEEAAAGAEAEEWGE